jgi:formate hydrogenlyase transcriptional activator
MMPRAGSPLEQDRVAQERTGGYAAASPLPDGADARDAAPAEAQGSQPALARAFAKLRSSEARLRKIIDSIPTLAWWSLPDGSRKFFNKRWHDYTGLDPEEARGWGWQAAIHPDDLDALTNKCRELRASGAPGELEGRLRRFDGEYRRFLFRADSVRDEHGAVVEWYGTDTDIEDLKRAESLHTTEKRTLEADLRRITDAIPQCISVIAVNGRTVFANRVLLEYAGVGLDDVTSLDFHERVFHPDDVERVQAERQRALSGEASFELEQRLRRHDGNYRWFLFRYSPFRDEHGRVVRWYATGTDIEDRKQAEERVRNENLALREDIDRSSMFEEIVGSSEGLRRVLAQVVKVAPTDSTVLILGETGTGKELIARAIHKRSSRASRAFIRVNCAAIPPSLVASELFGHEKGAFTGAVQRRVGRFESANGGTIFLDEIGDLPTETQIALLRVLQEREFERIGSSRPVSVDVRVVAATNRELKAAMTAGSFREDLFYRLNVFPVRIPPLRERQDDIPLLVQYLIERYTSGARKKIRNIDRKTLEMFRAYEWPGNVRELQNVVERAVILCDGETFAVDEWWLRRENQVPGATVSLAGTLAEREREVIETALAASRGRVSGLSGAAAKLGIPRQTLDSKIRALQINKHRFKPS